MAPPFFYAETISAANSRYTLDEENSKHVVQVLRMRTGQPLLLTNGAGGLFEAQIIHDHKKHCEVLITSFSQAPPPTQTTTIAISLLKNAARFEWFLEKATEMGITEIIPLLCQHTEKQRFRIDRMKNIMISALLQSRQSWLPVLHEPQPVEKIIRSSTNAVKWIAHCAEGKKERVAGHLFSDSLLLIGPEGDFSAAEIELALQHQFSAVTLGVTRLRTETAGVAGAVLMKMG
jgi:16S rRNA (uracil1498-N3)-methyltransferase